MTKEEAKKKAQTLLADAMILVAEAEGLMDTHRFSLSFLDKDYCPRDITEAEQEEGDLPIGQYVYAGEGGVWQGSSDMC